MKEEGSLQAAKSIFLNYISEKKMRKTPERIAILENIFSCTGHFDADYLFKIMNNDYHVSLATIYNTLELLVDCRLIIKNQFNGNSAQYEKIFDTPYHHHLICEKCGSIKEFTDNKIRDSINAKKFAKFKVSHYSLNLFGICRKCQTNK